MPPFLPILRHCQHRYYTFWVQSDDGARLWVADELLVDALDEEGSAPQRNGTLSFQAQPDQLYEVRLQYRQVSGEARVVFGWQSDNTYPEVVPAEALYPTGVPIAGVPFQSFSNAEGG